MTLINTITEKEFGRDSDPQAWPTYPIRKAARAILFNDENEIALMYVKSDNYYKLPGGGVDKGEDLRAALARELAEEVGASSIEVVGEVGRVDSYLEVAHSKSEHVCFVARLSGSLTEPKRTDKEVQEGYETIWARDIVQAIELVESGKPTQYGHDFERMRELSFLKHFYSQRHISENLK